MEDYKELYNKVYKELFATLSELQHTEPSSTLKQYLQTKLEVYYDLIGDTLDEDWYPIIEKQLK